jgi:hypothetical protein
MRAMRILSIKQEVIISLASLCEEREEEVPRSASQRNSYNSQRYNAESVGIGSRSQSANGSPVVPRMGLSSLSTKCQEPFQPQFAPSTPITITAPGSSSVADIPSKGLSQNTFVPAVLPPTLVPPPHMAPQRGKWTSPPPDHAPPQRHNSFNERLASGIKMAVTHPLMERNVPPRSSSGSSVTDPDDERDDLLEMGLGSGDTRSSSPVSSAGFSIPEFKPRNKRPIRIPSSDDQTPTPASTSMPINRPRNGSQSRPQWRHGHNQTNEMLSSKFKIPNEKAAGALPVSIGSLPTLKIPTHPFYHPSLGTSPNGSQWMDYNCSNNFGPTSAPPRSAHGYTPHRENSYPRHREFTPREGVRPNRSGSKSCTPNSPFVMNSGAVFGIQNGIASVTLTPQQLPTPPVSSTLPVSSPYSGLQFANSSPQTPMLLLEEPSASAR